MKRLAVILTLLIPSFLAAVGQTAKTLPELAPDPAIESGQLPNGVRYYLATDRSEKSVYSFSLVQKLDGTKDVEDVYAIARERFTAIDFQDVTLDEFLGRNGMLPSPEGYIKCTSRSIRYSFDGYSSARGIAVLDTVLLSIFKLAQAASVQGQPSSSQAIIVAGDFSRNEILSKMNTLCLVNPNVPGTVATLGDNDLVKGQPVTASITLEGGASVKVVGRWHLDRTPYEYISTMLPIVSGRMVSEFGKLACYRLEDAFRNAGYEVWMDFRHTDSGHSDGDEMLSLTVGCPGLMKEAVSRIFREEMDKLYTYGISPDEYAFVRDAVMYEEYFRSHSMTGNAAALADRCAASFIYGSSLAAGKEKMRFAYRDLPDSTQSGYFNRFIRGILSQTSGIDSTLTSPVFGESKSIFSTSLAMYAGARPLKSPKEKNEYLTGGVMWTFSNGVNVIYKQMPTLGMTYFSYAARGGRRYANPSSLGSIAGFSEETFRRYLLSEGVDMKVSLHPSDVRLEGKVPTSNIETMLQAISAITANSDNYKVFAPETYKLLVLVGDRSQEDVRKMMMRYAATLRQGAKWKSVKHVEEVVDESLTLRRYEYEDHLFQFDISSHNLAVASIAALRFRDVLGNVFSSYGVSFLHEQGYLAYPHNSYRFLYGVRNAGLEHFSLLRERLTEDVAASLVAASLSDPATCRISGPELAMYKTMVKDAFASRKSEPDFFIAVAMDRYLNNLDLSSSFPAAVDSVTADDLKNFYAAAAASDR